MKTRGFTLIELMIVVAIIAIVAAVALPSLLRARMAANETAAVAACKAYGSAQYVYRRTDYNGDGVLEFAKNLKGNNSLFETSAGLGDLAMIDRAFADAEFTALGTAVAKGGYIFCANVRGSGSSSTPTAPYDSAAGNRTLGFAITAMPFQYDGTGRNVFEMANDGTIYHIDSGNTLPTPNTAPDIYYIDSSWTVAE